MADKQKRPQAEGLKWRKRRNGPDVPYWFASEKAVAAGYPVKSANLSQYASNDLLLVDRAQRLHNEMLKWLAGQKKTETKFDGTFKSLLLIYQCDPASSFNTKIKPGTVRIYTIYLGKLVKYLGTRRIDHCDGRDVMKWFPEAERTGPLIVKETSGLPYSHDDFRRSWRSDATAAGLPVTLWNRDLRAGGITEGGKAGAAKDDRRKLAGHAREETTEIYDRETVEAHRRVMQSRKAFRERKNEP